MVLVLILCRETEAPTHSLHPLAEPSNTHKCLLAFSRERSNSDLAILLQCRDLHCAQYRYQHLLVGQLDPQLSKKIKSICTQNQANGFSEASPSHLTFRIRENSVRLAKPS